MLTVCVASYNCIVKIHSATIATIESDCRYDRTGDDGLREVITKWKSRTYKKEQTWQRLLDVSKEIDDDTLQTYLTEHNLSCKIL